MPDLVVLDEHKDDIVDSQRTLSFKDVCDELGVNVNNDLNQYPL